MSGAHLSAEALQQYILDKQGCTPENIAHMDSCPDCQAQVAAYTLLMVELSQQPPPVFGFDVSAVVMGRLAESPVAERAVERRIDSAAGAGSNEGRTGHQAGDGSAYSTDHGRAGLAVPEKRLLCVHGLPGYLFIPYPGGGRRVPATEGPTFNETLSTHHQYYK